MPIGSYSILKLIPKKSDFIEQLEGCKNTKVRGCWEENLLNSVDDNGNALYLLHRMKLKKNEWSRKFIIHNKHSTSKNLSVT